MTSLYGLMTCFNMLHLRESTELGSQNLGLSLLTYLVHISVR